MDDMKPRSEIYDALRQVGKRRDELLGQRPTLSFQREAILTGFLAREFLVETELCHASAKRDQLLKLGSPEIPALVESILHGQLDALQPAAMDRAPQKLDGLKPSSLSMPQLRAGGDRMSNVGERLSLWPTFFRLRLGIVLTGCAVMVAALLWLGNWGASSRRNATLPDAPRVEEVNVVSGTELFTRKVSIGPFNLDTNQPASLQAFLLTNRDVHFGDGIDATLGLRLDLPVRAIFMEDSLARTP
jgi:hypothetical protein